MRVYAFSPVLGRVFISIIKTTFNLNFGLLTSFCTIWLHINIKNKKSGFTPVSFNTVIWSIIRKIMLFFYFEKCLTLLILTSFPRSRYSILKRKHIVYKSYKSCMRRWRNMKRIGLWIISLILDYIIIIVGVGF